jgi:hypothetical protein
MNRTISHRVMRDTEHQASIFTASNLGIFDLD